MHPQPIRIPVAHRGLRLQDGLSRSLLVAGINHQLLHLHRVGPVSLTLEDLNQQVSHVLHNEFRRHTQQVGIKAGQNKLDEKKAWRLTF